MKRFIAILCAILLLVNTAAAEGVFTLPKDLKTIGEEAFLAPVSDIESESEFGLPDVIVVPEGTETIHARSFANQPASRIELPRSLSYISDSAFDGCSGATLYVWRDSYAHQWCMEHDVRYAVRDMAENEAVYEVHSVDIAENGDGSTVFRCVVTTTEACFLLVEVLDDAGENILSTVIVPADGSLSDMTVDVLPENALPRYFVLRAVLADGDGNPLCAPVTNSRYTSFHEECAGQTPDDFAGETVLDYGEYGFAVPADGVIPLNAAATVSGSSYTFAASRTLNKGDVVLLNVDGVRKPVKIASVTNNSNGTVTVVQDTNAGLDELYSFINMSGVMVADDVQAASLDDEGVTLSTKKSITVGPVRAGYSLKATIRATFIYNEETDYLDTSILIDTEGSLEAFLGKKYDTWKKNNAPAVTLFMTGVKIPYVDIEGTFKVTVPVNVQASAGGNVFISFNNHYGYTYNSADGFQKVEQSNASASGTDIKGQFAIKVGPEASFNASLFGAMKGRVGGQIGPLLEGEIKSPANEYEDGVDYVAKHACAQCIDMDLSMDVNLRATLTGKIGKASITYIDYNLGLYKEKIKDYYLSFDNEPESVHGGETVFGTDDCPNYQYLTKLLAKAADGTDQPGTPITLSGSKTETVSGGSPLTTYLYPGSYTAAAAFDSGNVSKTFDVTKYAETIPIYEQAIIIEGDVRDVDTYEVISGATVTLTLPDGSTQSKTTGADGTFRFEGLPEGVYTVTAGAQGYKSYTHTTQEYKSGTTYSLTITLVKGSIAIEGTVRDNDTGMPISGAGVTVKLPNGTTRYAMTPSDGTYRFEELPAGEYSLTAAAANYTSETRSGMKYDAFTENTVNFSLKKNDVLVEGAITDKNTGKPVAGATVTALLPDGTTRSAAADANGVYRFEHLPEGEYTLTASAKGYGSSTLSGMVFAAVSANTVNFTLESVLPDEEIMRTLLEAMGEDMVQQLKDAGYTLNGSFDYYEPRYASVGDPVMLFTISISNTYPRYSTSKELYDEALYVTLDSGIFPLSDERLASVKEELSELERFDISITQGGFSIWRGMPVNDVTLQFSYRPDDGTNLYDRQWTRKWRWNEITYSTIK